MKSIMASKCTQILGAFDRSVPGCSFGFVVSVWRKNTLGTRLKMVIKKVNDCRLKMLNQRTTERMEKQRTHKGRPDSSASLQR